MSIRRPRIIKKYVDSSNRHDVKSIVACFSEAATVHDENRAHQGKKAIKDWALKTIEKYKFHLQPLSVDSKDGEIIVAVKVSGTFDGSPVTLVYHFGGGKIISLAV